MSQYITATLVNSQVIISEMIEKSDNDEYYILVNPTKPIMMPDTNKILLVAMNPFSDSTEYKLHVSHVLTIGSLSPAYIDAYVASTKVIKENSLKNYDVVDDVDELLEEAVDIAPVKKSYSIHWQIKISLL